MTINNKKAYSNVFKGLKTMLDHYRDLEYFTGDYNLEFNIDDAKNNYEDTAILTFESGKELIIKIDLQLDRNLCNTTLDKNSYIDVNYHSCTYNYNDHNIISNYDLLLDDNKADLLAVYAGDGTLVVFDLNLFKQTFLDNRDMFMYHYGYSRHIDTKKNITGVIDGKKVISFRHCTEEQYLSLSYNDLLTDDISDTLTIIWTDSKEVVY